MSLNLWQDFLFGALASMGFSLISNPPVKSLALCGIIAGLGHGIRFMLIGHGWSLIAATFIAALAIGVMAVLCSRRVKCPAECLSFPSLLPMIPGMYAYRMVEGLIACLHNTEGPEFNAKFDMFCYNLLITFSVILMMVIGITIPVFLLKHISFTATK